MDSLPICATCGMQYASPRPDCPICEDDRQWVPRSGQQWTDLRSLRAEHTALIQEEGEGVLGIACQPKFAIGQRALLISAGSGNFLWDCAPYLDDEIIEKINGLGGLTGIAISHPHYYATVVDWAHAFDVPVHLHEKDREWVGRPDPAIEFWGGETKRVAEDLTLVHLGVHFAGGTVLHWPDGEQGKGALFTGDIANVVADRKHVAFMYSYPNQIPERPSLVRRAAEILAGYRFDTVYGAWWDAVIRTDGHDVVQRSAKRYLDFVSS